MDEASWERIPSDIWGPDFLGQVPVLLTLYLPGDIVYDTSGSSHGANK